MLEVIGPCVLLVDEIQETKKGPLEV